MEMKNFGCQLRVRHVRSNKFLKSTGRWTRKAEAAFNFPSLLNAVHTCVARGLKDVELILRREGEANEHRIPLKSV